MSHKRRPRRWYLALAGAAALAAAIPVMALASPWHYGYDYQRSHGYVSGPAQLRALTADPQCYLRIPRYPLTAQGLATPYVLSGSGCAEDQNTGAFVQATILNPRTGAVSVYDPEVVTQGEAAPVPPVPVLPRGAVVGIWTGFNGNVLKFTGPGVGWFTNFAQQGYANAPATFAALNIAVHQDRLTVPALTTASDGRACPTSRDFSIVDQDQSDNVPVTYTYAGDVSNGSDEQLLDLVDAALSCPVWTVPLLDPGIAQASGNGSPDGMLQELQASYTQAAPVALVPGLDDFVTGNGQPASNGGEPDLYLLDLYRANVDQPFTWNDNDTTAYCETLAGPSGAGRLAQDYQTETAAAAPTFAEIGTNLANVLAGRYAATWQLLTCTALTGIPQPVTVTTDPVSGLVTAAVYTPQP